MASLGGSAPGLVDGFLSRTTHASPLAALAINYPGNLSMKVADMTTFKILVNSTLSTPGPRWLGLDIKNYYLGTPMDDYEYMFIPINSIPHEIIAHYKLRDIDHNSKVYMEICRGMYGLPQAGILAEKQLLHFLSSDRIPSTTPGAEPPRDARDSGSARSHSTHLETSPSDRP